MIFHPMPADPVLDVQMLVCRYTTAGSIASEGKRTAVIDGISFSIGEGECMGLLGDSGSGKSTIARCVAGLTQPESGSITILGTNVFPSKKMSPHLRGKIQMLYQDHSASLDPMLTIRESLSEAVRMRTVAVEGRHTPHRRHAVETAFLVQMLQQVGLAGDVLEQRPQSLSGGERQRVALARSLAVDPALLVLDEPTSALDQSTQIQILELLGSIRKHLKTAVLFISHDIDAVAYLCSHIAVLFNGRIVEHDTAESILTHPTHPYTQRIVELHR
jgi:ABC-type glutathione transport system ATPase component